MTSFAVQTSMGAIAPLVSKDKGSVGNRMNCAGEHIKNNLSTGVQATAVAGSTALAYSFTNKMTKGKAMDWNIKFNKALKNLSKDIAKQAKIFNNSEVGKYVNMEKGVTKAGKQRLTKLYGKTKGKIAGLACNLGTKFISFTKNAIDKIAKTSGRQKILTGIVLSGLVLLTHVLNKHNYKAGQIDQKYTDRAKMEQHFE